MKRIGLILLITALLGAFAYAEGTISTDIVQTNVPTATPEPTGEIFSCEMLIVTLPVGYTILSEAEIAGYTAAVEDAYQTNAQLLCVARNESNSAIFIAAIEDTSAAPDACRVAAKNMLGNADNACEYVYGENSYVGFACALDDDVYQIYYISDGTHLVTICTANLDAEEVARLLESLDF